MYGVGFRARLWSIIVLGCFVHHVWFWVCGLRCTLFRGIDKQFIYLKARLVALHLDLITLNPSPQPKPTQHNSDLSTLNFKFVPLLLYPLSFNSPRLDGQAPEAQL